MIPPNLVTLAKHVQKYLENESSGHDYYHAVRVLQNALYIQKFEGGDIDIIGASALIHDMCRPWEKKTGKSHFGEEALRIIEGTLKSADISPSNIKSILQIVAKHDIYDWTDKQNDKTIELQILQDADNLEAIGAIGIARTFAFGGSHGLSMYNPGENLDFDHDFVEDPNKRTSTIAHFYEKLLKLKDNMNTKKGREIAEKRHQLMENFLKEFFNEWEGKF